MAINFPNSPSNGDVFGNFTYDTSIPGWRKTPENSASLPAGTIVQWPGATAPANWLICDGAAVSRTTYASLFAAIGVQYGSGDGTTTFNLPNLKGRVAVGLDSSQTEFNTLGETGGSKTHTLTEAEMPNHTHTQNSHTHTFSGTTSTDGNHYHTSGANSNGFVAHATGGGGYAVGFSNAGAGEMMFYRYTDYAGSHTHTYSGTTSTQSVATNQSTGGGGAHNNLQPYIVLNYIIKTSAGITSGDSELATRVGIAELDIDALQLADSTTNKSGLVPIIPSSVTVSSGTASVASDGTVTFSAASGIAIDGIFSATYRNYRAMTDVTSVYNAIYLWQGRVGGSTTSSTNYYYNELYASAGTVGAGGSGPSGGTNNGRVAYMEAGTFTSVSMDIYSPQIASHTQTFSTHGRLSAGGTPVLVTNTGGCQLTTQFTGIYFSPSAGTFSGTVKFYGYR